MERGGRGREGGRGRDGEREISVCPKDSANPSCVTFLKLFLLRSSCRTSNALLSRFILSVSVSSPSLRVPTQNNR